MVEAVCSTFPKVAVVLNVGGMVASNWFASDDRIQSVLMAWQGGMEGGAAAAELLCGFGNPSGKLVDTFARDLVDYPSTAGFHESENYVDYTEDIFVGYRYFETLPGAADKVIYPFGYGLSYTTFQYSNMQAEKADGIYTVTVDVKNTGDREGAEVVQLYIAEKNPTVLRPNKELKAFRKVTVEPGKKVVVTFEVDKKMCSYWCDKNHAWTANAGEYEILIGTSSADIVAVLPFVVK